MKQLKDQKHEIPPTLFSVTSFKKANIQYFNKLANSYARALRCFFFFSCRRTMNLIKKNKELGIKKFVCFKTWMSNKRSDKRMSE